MRKFSLIFMSAAAGAALTLLATQPSLMLAGASALAAASDKGAGSIYSRLELFGNVFELVRADYVDQPNDTKLIDSAIDGMLSGLDPHSSYMDANSFRDMQVETKGEFGGLGMEVTMDDAGLVKVVAPIDDTPAAKAGIRADDIITAIDDEPLKGLTLQQAIDKIRGPVNTSIRLKIVRKGEDKPIDFTLKREIIHVNSVTFHKEGDDIGYIRISQFNEQTTSGLKHALAELAQQIPAGKLKGYILDLRNDPGGLLDEAISVSNVFLSRGEIVSIRGRKPDDTQRFSAKAGAGDLIKGKPLIVLINGGSASASEIVAGALQDHKRATLIGTRSFGKGSVQTIIPLGPGNGALRLTTARYYTPSGRSIQAKGITPDIEVLQDDPRDGGAVAAGGDRMSEATLRGHLKAAEGAEEKGSQAYVPKDTKDDKALHMAEDILRGEKVSPAFPPNRKQAKVN
jgi:carboxyl-terminal processing protease